MNRMQAGFVGFSPMSDKATPRTTPFWAWDLLRAVTGRLTESSAPFFPGLAASGPACVIPSQTLPFCKGVNPPFGSFFWNISFLKSEGLFFQRWESCTCLSF